MHRPQNGFTIIELILVLAITGLVAAMTLVGIGSGLQNERYRDAVNQALDYFQGQYSDIANISNERTTDITCTSTAVVEATDPNGRGTSNCLLLGYLLKSPDGKNITRQQVVALRDQSKSTSLAESQALSDSDLRVVPGTEELYQLEWNTTLTLPGQSTGTPFTLMLIRSPTSGLTRTYSNTDSGDASIATLLASGQVERTFCIDPEGLLSLGTNRSGFVIDRSATDSSGIRLKTTGSC